GAEVRIGGSSLPGMREKGAGGGRGSRGPAPEGEILVRGPMLFRGYGGEPGRPAVALRGGWLHTGDLGRIHHDGRLVVLGRVDDLVISGGGNVHPDEGEAGLAGHPGGG